MDVLVQGVQLGDTRAKTFKDLGANIFHDQRVRGPGEVLRLDAPEIMNDETLGGIRQHRF